MLEIEPLKGRRKPSPLQRANAHSCREKVLNLLSELNALVNTLHQSYLEEMEKYYRRDDSLAELIKVANKIVEIRKKVKKIVKDTNTDILVYELTIVRCHYWIRAHARSSATQIAQMFDVNVEELV